MARRVWCALTLCALLAISQHATAQSLGQAAGARKTPTVDPELRADIEKLMVVTGAANLATQLAAQVTDAFLNSVQQTTQAAIPPRMIEIVREVLNTEFANGFNGPEIRDRLIALYAKYFTREEVRGLIAFYESDLGRKAVSNLPSLMREGGEIGQRWAQDSLPTIMQTLQARLKAEGLIP